MADRRLVHNEADTRYELLIDDVVVGYVDYERQGSSLVIVHHTWVNDEYEGQGIGSAIVAGAMADFRARQYKVVPQCSFVAAWLTKHPEYADVRA